MLNVNTKKFFGLFVTLALVIGVGIAIYQSAKKQKTINLTADQPTSIKEKTDQPNRKDNTYPSKSIRVSSPIEPNAGYSLKETKPYNPKPQSTRKGFFEGKISEDTTLHLIGIFEGEEIPGKDYSPWWSHCNDLKDQKEMMECHKKYAGLEQQKKVKVKISYDKSPVVIALTAVKSTLWSIDLKKGVRLEGVIIAGSESQEIIGLPVDIKIISFTRKSSKCGDCVRGQGHFFAYKEDENFIKTKTRLKQITGKETTSVQMTHSSGDFTISNFLD